MAHFVTNGYFYEWLLLHYLLLSYWLCTCFLKLQAKSWLCTSIFPYIEDKCQNTGPFAPLCTNLNFVNNIQLMRDNGCPAYGLLEFRTAHTCLCKNVIVIFIYRNHVPSSIICQAQFQRICWVHSLVPAQQSVVYCIMTSKWIIGHCKIIFYFSKSLQ